MTTNRYTVGKKWSKTKKHWTDVFNFDSVTWRKITKNSLIRVCLHLTDCDYAFSVVYRFLLINECRVLLIHKLEEV